MRWLGRVLCLGGLACILGASPARAQFITSVDFSPANPSTGDPVTLEVAVIIPQNCFWKPTATISFGRHEEFAPQRGWRVDFRLTATTAACSKPSASLRFRIDLGILPVASGPGLLRLDLDGRDTSSAQFELAVGAGPAPGWRNTVLHGSRQLFLVSAGLTAIRAGVLAISDVAFREILIFELRTLRVLDKFPGPGLTGLVRGLAFDGTHLFASTQELFVPPRIFKLTLEGVTLNSYASPTFSPFNRPLEGLAFRDGVLYGTIESPPTLFAIDPDDGRKLWQRSLPVRVLGLTSVPEGLVGLEPGGSALLIEPSPDGFDRLLGDLVDMGFAGIPGGVNLTGLAFDGVQLFAWDETNSSLRSIRSLALWWNSDGDLLSYVPRDSFSVDVIRGNVSNLRFLVFNSGLGATTCLVSEGSGGRVPADDDPPPGEAHFYLARVRSPGLFKTSYGRASFGFRRLESATIPGACP